MTTILHVASSSNLQGSFTRQIGAATMEELKKSYPDATVIERDLVKSAIPHVSPAFLSAMFSGKEDASELALSQQLVDELRASDIVVIEAPMYNFSIPSALKAWIDHVVRAGKTFQYGASGPQGLLTGKKAIVVLSRGGVYTEGPAAIMDHQEPYLRSILSFTGITDIKVIHIEGVNMGQERSSASVAKAKERIRLIVDESSLPKSA